MRWGPEERTGLPLLNDRQPQRPQLRKSFGTISHLFAPGSFARGFGSFCSPLRMQHILPADCPVWPHRTLDQDEAPDVHLATPEVLSRPQIRLIYSWTSAMATFRNRRTRFQIHLVVPSRRRDLPLLRHDQRHAQDRSSQRAHSHNVLRSPCTGVVRPQRRRLARHPQDQLAADSHEHHGRGGRPLLSVPEAERLDLGTEYGVHERLKRNFSREQHGAAPDDSQRVFFGEADAFCAFHHLGCCFGDTGL